MSTSLQTDACRRATPWAVSVPATSFTSLVAMSDLTATTSSAYKQALEVLPSVEPRLADATRAELADKRSSLKLIASANSATPAVLLTLGTWLSDEIAEWTVGLRCSSGVRHLD